MICFDLTYRPSALRFTLLAGLALASVGATGCSAGVDTTEAAEAEESTQSIAQEQRIGNGRTPAQEKCDDKQVDCYLTCSFRYPDSNDSTGNLNSDMRDGCLDSCDASHRLCTATRTGGTIGVAKPVTGGTVKVAR